MRKRLNELLVYPILMIALFSADSMVAPAWPQIQTRTNIQTTPAKKRQVAEALSDAEIGEARRLLDRLGYWTRPEATGNEVSLRHALIAFQKIEDRERTGILTREELEALRRAQRPQLLESGYPHIEIDLGRQVLFVLDCVDAVPRILPISSGSGELFTEGGVTRRAITPTGTFKVYRKIEGWRKSPLGLLYYPNYIYGGIAIHGSPSVPPIPASHGCIRIPMFAAVEFSTIATIDMDVIVYESNPLTQAEAPQRAQH
jgi:L,D-transpeptidase-like protein